MSISLKVKFLIILTFILISCRGERTEKNSEEIRNIQVDEYISDYSENIQFDVANLLGDDANIDLDSLEFSKNKDKLVCSFYGDEVIFYDPVGDVKIDRRLSYWDSVMDLDTDEVGGKIRYDELFILSPEASQITKIISGEFEVYIIIDLDNSLDGIIWYGHDGKSARIKSEIADEAKLLRIFTGLSHLEGEFIKRLNKL